MTKSKLWLLDEPVSGLDKKTKFLILKLITDHLDSGGGAIITSHQNLIILNRSKNKRVLILIKLFYLFLCRESKGYLINTNKSWFALAFFLLCILIFPLSLEDHEFP